MQNPVYIFGHKNPDADSICAAIAYGAFKSSIDQKNFIPARCGNTNARINSILDHFNVPPPLFIGDVTPRVHDIMIPYERIHKVRTDNTCAEALEIIDQHDIRALPVVDHNDHLKGLLSIFSLGNYFIPKPNEPRWMRSVSTNILSIARSLKAKTLNLVNEHQVEELFVRTGAMATSTFGDFSHKEGDIHQSILVIGNREDLQLKAIEMGIRLLVIVGKHPISDSVLNKAKSHNVSVLLSPFDVASTAWLIRSAVPIENLIQKDVITFNSDEKLAVVKRKIATNPAPLYCVTNDENRLLGIFTKTDLLRPVNTQIVLVDHNELTQAVNGANEVQILEIVDHHKLGNPTTNSPIRFINEPVGSTCTIIANMFLHNQLTPSKEIAGIMMGGIISDTLLLRSPTTTTTDRKLLAWLSDIAQVSPNDLADKIFNSGSIILSSPPAKVIESDCKIYEENNYRYSASQVEELGFENFWANSSDLLEALDAYRKKENLTFAVLLVTDVDTQNSLLLIQGPQEIIDLINYPQVTKEPIFELEGIVSRKKQLVPFITSLLTGSPNSAS